MGTARATGASSRVRARPAGGSPSAEPTSASETTDGSASTPAERPAPEAGARERKGTTSAQRSSQLRLAAALDTERIGVWDWDPLTDRAVGTDSMAEVFGLRPGETLDVTAFDFGVMHPDDVEHYRALVRVAGAHGEGWHSVFRIVRPRDGQVAWIEEHATATRDPATGAIHVTALIWDVTERMTAEAEHERLLVAEGAATERQALLKRIVQAQEDERARLAREVHDTLAQFASSAALHLDQAADLLPVNPGLALPELEKGRDLVRRVAKEARRMIAGLRPVALDDFGLTGAIRHEVDELAAAGWWVDFEDGDLLGVRLDPEAEITLYRVAQEALANVRQHAGRARVRVRLRRMDGEVRLEVRDWGRGFDQLEVSGRSPGEHVGMTGMRERMALLGGRLEVRSGLDHGTIVRAVLPVEDRGEQVERPEL